MYYSRTSVRGSGKGLLEGQWLFLKSKALDSLKLGSIASRQLSRALLPLLKAQVPSLRELMSILSGSPMQPAFGNRSNSQPSPRLFMCVSGLVDAMKLLKSYGLETQEESPTTVIGLEESSVPGTRDCWHEYSAFGVNMILILDAAARHC